MVIKRLPRMDFTNLQVVRKMRKMNSKMQLRMKWQHSKQSPIKLCIIQPLVPVDKLPNHGPVLLVPVLRYRHEGHLVITIINFTLIITTRQDPMQIQNWRNKNDYYSSNNSQKNVQPVFLAPF